MVVVVVVGHDFLKTTQLNVSGRTRLLVIVAKNRLLLLRSKNARNERTRAGIERKGEIACGRVWKGTKEIKKGVRGVK